ncbi:hypothetical protein [Ureibacillus galli]|nr:hypothetical protein [Ureibacillus galli]
MKPIDYIKEFFALIGMIISIPIIILLSPLIVFYFIFELSRFGRG